MRALPAARRHGDATSSRRTRATSTTAEPVYETLPGWQEPLDGVDGLDALPAAARRYVEFVEQQLGVEVCLIGTGASREHVLSPRGSKPS